MTCQARHTRLVLIAVFTAVLLSACVTAGVVMESPLRQKEHGPMAVTVEQCIDRTETAGRDLGTEARRAFEKKLAETSEFVPQANARYRLACEVKIFVKGNVFVRWLTGGLPTTAGATVGKVSSMLTDTTTGDIVVIVEGNATVAGGGLYTIGAEEYIIPTAVGDVVTRLRDWAQGKPVGTTPSDTDIPQSGKQ